MSRGHGRVQRQLLESLRALNSKRPDAWVQMRDLAGGDAATRSDMEKTRRALLALEREDLVQIGHIEWRNSEVVVARLNGPDKEMPLGPPENLPLVEIEGGLAALAEIYNDALHEAGSLAYLKVHWHPEPVLKVPILSLEGHRRTVVDYDPRTRLAIRAAQLEDWLTAQRRERQRGKAEAATARQALHAAGERVEDAFLAALLRFIEAPHDTEDRERRGHQVMTLLRLINLSNSANNDTSPDPG
ncbi:hypothetical protein [Streptomyces sp. NBC_00690]|uniref:hypothetical protein n=1 Tax=Streptomyces sp. NBC_00690 TaxID=2975808 RepID=UPI002E2E6C7D|nr:hypothetical protein [Streptomyces sp. NBC_00690]